MLLSIILGKICCVEVTLTFLVVPCNVLEVRYIINLIFCLFGRSVFKNVKDGNWGQFFFEITLKVENIYGLFPVKFLGRKRENSALEVLFPPHVSNCFCNHCM